MAVLLSETGLPGVVPAGWDVVGAGCELAGGWESGVTLGEEGAGAGVSVEFCATAAGFLDERFSQANP